MAVEKKFIQQALDDLQVKEFLTKELDKAGVSSISLQKTPIATRITVRVRRPGLVVGKKGKAIKDLCDMVTRKYGIENPQFEVIEVTQPSLDAQLMAEKIGRRLEMRPNVKPIMRMAIREIMESGALGVELQAAGKIVGKGGKAKTFRMRHGHLKKSGNPAKLVRKGHFVAYLKAGAVGIAVSIVPPDAIFPDSIVIPKKVAPTLDVDPETPVAPTDETVAEEKTDESVETAVVEPASSEEKKAVKKSVKKRAKKKQDADVVPPIVVAAPTEPQTEA